MVIYTLRGVLAAVGVRIVVVFFVLFVFLGLGMFSRLYWEI